MRDFLDVYQKALEGPIMSEHEFELKQLMPGVNRIVNKYGIRYDKQNPVPGDDESADNLFRAAVEFMEQVGVYCMDTNRVMRFSGEEIDQVLKNASGKCYAGEGKDADIFEMRKPDDKKKPWLHVGSGIVCTSKEIMTNLIEAYGSIEKANSISISSFDSIRGISVTSASPAELYAAIDGVNTGRQALRRAGRPGLPIMNLISTAAAAVTTIAASAPQFGLRPSDGWLCGAISEMKVDYGAMNKVAYLQNWGANVGAETSPILGGYAGGPAGTAVVSTAYILMGLLVFMGNYQLTFPIHFNYGCSSTRDVLWAVSFSCQAASRNISMPVIWLGYMAAGPNTKMYFYEAAAYILTAVTSGAPSVQTPHPAKAVKIDGITPMEANFGVETALAAARLNRSSANEIVNKLLEKYEKDIPGAPSGSRYQECYDAQTGKSSEEYLRLYHETKEELCKMGIPY
ncbi:MAG: monomethylamine:corrinoid methyltransferase [Spirochaetota bacterium]